MDRVGSRSEVPNNEEMTRFCLPPSCNGGSVIAFHDDGSIWETTDGGDGSLAEPASETIFLAAIPVLKACDEAKVLAKIFSNACTNGFTLISASLEGDTVHFSLDSLPSMPVNFGGGMSDSFYVTFTPNKIVGSFSTKLHITGKVNTPDSSLPFDTIIVINTTATPSSMQFDASISTLDFGSISMCTRQRDTTIVFTNHGCAPDSIMSITITGAGFTGPNDSLPIIVPPGDSVRFEYRFVPPATGSFSGTVQLHVTSMGLTEDPVISLSGIGIPAQAMLSLVDTALDLGTFARCNAMGDTTVTLTNSGCDSLSLSGASVRGGAGFTLVNARDTELAPNQSVQYSVHFSDSIAGRLASALHVHAVGAHGGNALDTSIALLATIVPGSHVAALGPKAIDFGITSICEERDSTITITNIGCETDTISTAIIASSQFVLPLSVNFPIVIPPGESAIIPISTNLDTTGQPVEILDTLDFLSNADAPLPPVVLSRGVNYPVRFSLGLTAEDSAPIRATVPVYVLRKGTVPKSVDEVNFDLIYNDDLLGYANVKEPDVQPVHAALLPNGLTDRTFTMKPAMDRDTIATLEFQSYLSKQEQTPILLTGEKFISGGVISPPCIASMDSGVGTGFTLELACGDGPIANALEGIPLDLVSMTISSSVLNFMLACGDATLTSCSAEILTVLGTRALGKTFTLEPVTSSTFDLHTLPAGGYFLRVSAGRSVISRRFVIVK